MISILLAVPSLIVSLEIFCVLWCGMCDIWYGMYGVSLDMHGIVIPATTKLVMKHAYNGACLPI